MGEEDKLILRTTPLKNEKQPPPLLTSILQNTTPTQHKNNSITTDVGLLLVTTKQNSTLPTQIYVAICSVESNGITTSLSKKNECPLLRSLSTGVFVSLFPDPGDNLDFNPPRHGTIYDKVLDKTKELELILIEHDALFVPGNPFQDQMKLAKVYMTRRAGGGTYYIVNYLNPNGKYGRAIELKSTKTNRYPDATTALVTVHYDSLPGFVLTGATKNLKEVYDIVREDFDDDGGVEQFLLTKQYDDAVQWEDASGGMSILSVISLHMMFDSYFGGDGHNNKLLKPFLLNQIESTQQLNRANHGHGEIHEHFWSNLFREFVIPSDRLVETSAQRLGGILEEATGKSLSELTFIQHEHSASWAPGLDVFSVYNLNKGLLELAEEVVGHDVTISTFGSLSDEVRSDIVDDFGEILDCDLSSVAHLSLREIANEAFGSCKKDDENFTYIVTQLMYDTLTGKENSYANGDWMDPFQRETDSERPYDPRASYDGDDRKYARGVTRKSVRDMKEDTDKCVDGSNVYYKFMVSIMILCAFALFSLILQTNLYYFKQTNTQPLSSTLSSLSTIGYRL